MFKLRNVGSILAVMGLILGLMVTPLLASNPERLVVAIGEWAKERWISQVVPRFEGEYKVEVEIKSYPPDELQEKLLLLLDALAGKFTYDVASIPYGYIRPFVQREFLEDLTQYEERFRKNKVVSVKYRGKAFGVSLPWTDSVESLVVFKMSKRKELALKLLQFAAYSEKPEQEEIKVSLESATMILALGFQDRDNRNKLYDMIRKSIDPEMKVKLREFASAMDYGLLEESVPEAREELINGIAIVEKRIQRDLNVYFPVDEHRKRWLDQRDKMLIAYDPFWLDEKEIEEIIAYDWDGNVHWLDSRVPPEIPTLVAARSEHIPLETEIETWSGDTTYLLKLRIPSKDMFDRIEPWFKGDAELYVWMVSRNERLRKQYWFPNYKRVWAEGGLWRDLEHELVIDWDPQRHTNTLYFSWWEYDGETIEYNIKSVAPRVPISGGIRIYDKDDEAGFLTVEYNSVPTSRPGRIYSTGIVEWELYKTE